MRQREFCCLLCPLPEIASEKIKAWSKDNILEDDLIADGREGSLHVSIKYGLHKHDPYYLKNVIWDFEVIKISLGKTSIFSTDDRDVVKIDVISPRLHTLNKLISDNFDHTEEHPKFLPHITLACVKSGLGNKYSGVDHFLGWDILLETAMFSGKDFQETIIPFKS